MAFEKFLQERHKVKLYEEALGVLEELAQSYRIGALTNGNADIYKTDAAEYFDFAFLAEEVGASKPAPDMFIAAIEESKVEPHQIVHVGDDANHDILGAQAVGMRTVWMNARNKDWPGGENADFEIKRLTELPAAIKRLSDQST